MGPCRGAPYGAPLGAFLERSRALAGPPRSSSGPPSAPSRALSGPRRGQGSPSNERKRNGEKAQFLDSLLLV
eukprot:8314120-Pyramimonas_sp.AAC.1